MLEDHLTDLQKLMALFTIKFWTTLPQEGEEFKINHSMRCTKSQSIWRSPQLNITLKKSKLPLQDFHTITKSKTWVTLKLDNQVLNQRQYSQLQSKLRVWPQLSLDTNLLLNLNRNKNMTMFHTMYHLLTSKSTTLLCQSNWPQRNLRFKNYRCQLSKCSQDQLCQFIEPQFISHKSSSLSSTRHHFHQSLNLSQCQSSKPLKSLINRSLDISTGTLILKLTDKSKLIRRKLDNSLQPTETNSIKVSRASTESRDLPSTWCHSTRPLLPHLSQLTSSLITTTTLPDRLTID